MLVWDQRHVFALERSVSNQMSFKLSKCILDMPGVDKRSRWGIYDHQFKRSNKLNNFNRELHQSESW